MKKVGVFVDLRNLYFAINKRFAGRRLDYHKYLKGTLDESSILLRAIAYGVQINEESEKFINALEYYGFQTKYKNVYVESPDPEERTRALFRENWNVGISIDIARLLDKLDVIILGSADRELIPLIEFIGEKGCECIIFASNIPPEIKEVATAWIEIGDQFLETINGINGKDLE